MPDAVLKAGCRATASGSSLNDLEHTKPVSPWHKSGDRLSYEILSSAIGELSKQNPNNLQEIDKTEKTTDFRRLGRWRR
jgi:hypothetical protein